MFGSIIDWFQIGLAGLWPLVWKFGISGVICLALVAAYFLMPAPVAAMFPNLRKWLLPIAGVFAISIVSYAVGVADEHNRKVEQDRLASIAAYHSGEKARTDALAKVAKDRAAAATRKSGKRVWTRAPGPDGYDRAQSRAKR